MGSRIKVITAPAEKRVKDMKSGMVFLLDAGDRWYIKATTDPRYEKSPDFNAFDLCNNSPVQLSESLIVCDYIEEPVILDKHKLGKINKDELEIS